MVPTDTLFAHHAVPILVVVCGHDGDLLALPVDVGDAVEGVGGDAPDGHALGCNSIDILNFGSTTGCKTGQSSGSTSVLGYYKFKDVSKLPVSGPDSGTKKCLLNCTPGADVDCVGRDGQHLRYGALDLGQVLRAKIVVEHLFCFVNYIGSLYRVSKPFGDYAAQE